MLVFKIILTVIINIKIIKKDILNDIYSVDDEGNEYWHGVKIESEKMTDEEVKELEDLLKNFK